MLLIRSRRSASRKSLKWPLFLILMIISILAYTHTSSTDIITNTKPAASKKLTKVENDNTSLHQGLALWDKQTNDIQHSSVSNKHYILKHNHSPANVIASDNQADIDQSFQFAEGEEPIDNNIESKIQNIAHFDPSNHQDRSQYISGGGASGGGGKGGKAGDKKDPSDNVKGNEPGNENISAVPLPPAIWLLGSALLGLAGLRRK